MSLTLQSERRYCTSTRANPKLFGNGGLVTSCIKMQCSYPPRPPPPFKEKVLKYVQWWVRGVLGVSQPTQTPLLFFLFCFLSYPNFIKDGRGVDGALVWVKMHHFLVLNSQTDSIPLSQTLYPPLTWPCNWH